MIDRWTMEKYGTYLISAGLVCLFMYEVLNRCYELARREADDAVSRHEYNHHVDDEE